jgi:hypothetical protein
MPGTRQHKAGHDDFPCFQQLVSWPGFSKDEPGHPRSDAAKRNVIDIILMFIFAST